MASTTIDTDVSGGASASSLALTDGTVLLIKKLTGTTGATQGSYSIIDLGSIDPDKVVCVTGLVNYSGTSWIGCDGTANAGYNFDAYISGTDMRLLLHASNSSALTSKPFKVLVTYHE